MPIGKPGERWVYSNVGFAIIGVIAEHRMGTPNERLVRAEILDALGEALCAKMEHSSPSTAGPDDWGDLSDHERQFYARSVQWIPSHVNSLRRTHDRAPHTTVSG